MRWFYLSFALLFLIIVPILAQEVTQEPIIPTETPPSPTLGLIYTDIPTNAPTSLPTDAPTEFPTSTVSATETPTGLATLTETPIQAVFTETSSPEAIATLTETPSEEGRLLQGSMGTLPNRGSGRGSSNLMSEDPINSVTYLTDFQAQGTATPFGETRLPSTVSGVPSDSTGIGDSPNSDWTALSNPVAYVDADQQSVSAAKLEVRMDLPAPARVSGNSLSFGIFTPDTSFSTYHLGYRYLNNQNGVLLEDHCVLQLNSTGEPVVCSLDAHVVDNVASVVFYIELVVNTTGIHTYSIGLDYLRVYAEKMPPAPRSVASEAWNFHYYAEEFGLPRPFDIWPVETIEDISWGQGYGPTSFAYFASPRPYNRVHQIHPGIDFSGANIAKAVVAVCDGVIVSGRTTGPYTGYGLGLRCFADDYPDSDADGNRNLSNIIVSYNHLDNLTRTHRPQSYDIVYKGELLGYTQAYYQTTTPQYCANTDDRTDDCILRDVYTNVTVDGTNYQVGLGCQDNYNGYWECKAAPIPADPDFRYCSNTGQDGYATDCTVRLHEEDPLVTNARGEGLTCIDTSGVDECANSIATNHLHLEVFIATGFKDINAIRVNPLMMFDATLTQYFITNSSGYSLGFYYPFDRGGNFNTTLSEYSGLLAGDLAAFTGQGSLQDTVPFQGGFFQIQIPTPVSQPEWWRDNLVVPTGYEGVPRMTNNIASFMVQYGYPSGTTYSGPNCIGISPAIPIVQLRQSGIVTCTVDVNDVNDSAVVR